MSDINSIGGLNPQINFPRLPVNKETAAGDSKNAQITDGFSRGEADTKKLSQSILDKLCSEPSVDDTRMLGNTRILPDNFGRVKHLALQISDYVGGSMRREVLDAYKSLFLNMEPDTKFTMVVGSDRDRKDVEKVMKDNNVPNPDRIQFIQPPLSLTVWARDQMIGMYFPNDDSKTALLNQTTFHSWHNDDTLVPPYIADKYPSIVLDKEPRIVTDGGEIVSTKNETFVGNFSIAETAAKLKEIGRKDPSFASMIKNTYEQKTGKTVLLSDQENPFPFKIVPREVEQGMHENPFKLEANQDYKKPVTRANEMSEGDMWIKAAKDLFAKEFGQPIIVMGEDDPKTPAVEGPANDHLDMAITPFDEKTVAVGDPSMVKKALDKMKPERKTEVLGQLSDIFGKTVTEMDFNDITDIKGYSNQQRDFDKYADNLKNKGFRILRMPYAEPDYGRPNVTYTNCLQEQFTKDDGTKVKRVFLPIFNIPELDSIAVNTYKKEGFEVFTIPMPNLATRKGALRCISHWLDRSH
ncbi:MAG: hypothetical protein AB9903_36395 [Vulcanimicrobiota bacterium]